MIDVCNFLFRYTETILYFYNNNFIKQNNTNRCHEGVYRVDDNFSSMFIVFDITTVRIVV